MTEAVCRAERARARKRLRSTIWRRRYCYLMLLPGVVVVTIFCYLPMGGLLMAFQDYRVFKGILGSEWVGLKHFVAFFSGRSFGRVLSNTLILNGYSLLFAFPLPLIFALMLNEIGSSAVRRTVQTITYLPHFISTVVVVSILKELLSPTNGIVNQLIMRRGGEPIYFFGRANCFRALYILSGAWQGTGWGSIIYLAAITGIDPVLYEAATIDGASRLQKIWHVTLPGIRSTFIIMLIMQMGKMLNSDFEKVLLMQTSGNRVKSELLSTYIYERGVLNSEFSYSTAVGFFNSTVSFLMILLANTISRRLTEESLW